MHFGFRPGIASLVFALAAGPAASGELTVSAAASLTDAFRQIGASFEAAHPRTTVRLNFAASGALLQQIVHGAPIDVLASADQATMDDAERRQLVRPQTRGDFAANALVVVVPHDASSVPASLADVATARVRRVAVGVPASVPVGRYTKAVLEQARLWPQVEAKMIGAQSVRQALDYVARGEVDAGFVYATDAASMAQRVRVAFVVPTSTPIRYPIAVLAASRSAAEAEQFVAFVRSPPAQAILRALGFATP